MSDHNSSSLAFGSDELKISKFSDLYAPALSIFLLCCKFQTIILKTVEVAETGDLLCLVNKAKILVNPRYVTLSIIIQSEFKDLYTHALIYSYFAASFSNNYLEKAKFLSKSRARNSINKNFDKSSVTLMHMLSLYSYFAVSLKSLS